MRHISFFRPFNLDPGWDIQQAFCFGRLGKDKTEQLKVATNDHERMRCVRISGDYFDLAQKYLCVGMVWPLPKKRRQR